MLEEWLSVFSVLFCRSQIRASSSVETDLSYNHTHRDRFDLCLYFHMEIDFDLCLIMSKISHRFDYLCWFLYINDRIDLCLIFTPIITDRIESICALFSHGNQLKDFRFYSKYAQKISVFLFLNISSNSERIYVFILKMSSPYFSDS